MRHLREDEREMMYSWYVIVMITFQIELHRTTENGAGRRMKWTTKLPFNMRLLVACVLCTLTGEVWQQRARGWWGGGPCEDFL